MCLGCIFPRAEDDFSSLIDIAFVMLFLLGSKIMIMHTLPRGHKWRMRVMCVSEGLHAEGGKKRERKGEGAISRGGWILGSAMLSWNRQESQAGRQAGNRSIALARTHGPVPRYTSRRGIRLLWVAPMQNATQYPHALTCFVFLRTAHVTHDRSDLFVIANRSSRFTRITRISPLCISYARARARDSENGFAFSKYFVAPSLTNDWEIDE